MNLSGVEQLWVLQGTKPCGWTVPFYVHLLEDNINAMMFSAVFLLNRHKKVVGELLESFGARQHNAQWLVTRVTLEAIGRKVELCDPETLFSWQTSTRSAPEGVALAPANNARDEFLDGLFQSGLFKSREALGVIYHQICMHSLDWMINKEKPVDMYFMRLHNCPYRVNWKTVLLSRFARLGRLLCPTRGFKTTFIANESGLMDELRCPDLLSMPYHEDSVRRTIEVEMTLLWHKTVREVERRRFKMLGATRYAQYLAESIVRWADSAVAIYKSWLNLVARPSACNVDCGKNGEFRLAPNIPPQDVYRHTRKGVPVPVVVPNRFPTVTPSSQPEDIFPKNGALPDEMSPVRPSSPDVRDRRPDLYRGPKWGGAQPGMLVLPPAQDGAAGELLGEERGTA